VWIARVIPTESSGSPELKESSESPEPEESTDSHELKKSSGSRSSKYESSESPEPEDILWDEINPDLDAFRTIISNHFGSPKIHSNLAHMLAHSSTFSRTASISSAGSFSLLDALSKPMER